MSKVCLFCRKISCESAKDCECSVPLFLTYLKTINVNYEEDNFLPEEFHSCRECGTLLGTIAQLVQKLGHELLQIYNITLENLPIEDGKEDGMEKLRRQIVADATEIRGQVHVAVKVQKNDAVIAPEDEVTVKMEFEEGEEVKVELDLGEENEFILPHEDPLAQCDDEGDYFPAGEEEGVDPKRFKSSSGTGDEALSHKFGDNLAKNSDIIVAIKEPSLNEVGSRNESLPVNETASRMPSEIRCHCGFATTTFSAMTRHFIDKHLGRIPIKCSKPSCPAQFATKELLIAHTKRDHLMKKCDHCDLTFTSAEFMNQHKNEFHKRCEICGLVFLKANFSYHSLKCRELEAHGGKKVGPVDSNSACLVVTKSVTPTGLVTYDCGRCGVKDLPEWDFLRHIRLHHAQKGGFKCPNLSCKSILSSETALEMHYRHSHMNTAPCGKLCNTCNTIFPSQESLDSHVRQTHARHVPPPTTANHLSEEIRAQRKAERVARLELPENRKMIGKCKFCGKNVLGTMKVFSEHESRCQLEVESWGKLFI